MAIRELLEGEPRKSQAGSNQALDRLLRDQSLVEELIACVDDSDELVQMRALDLIDKIARKEPQWIEPHRGLLLREYHRLPLWENRLQVARAIGVFRWEGSDHERAVEILMELVEDEQPFVKAWALDSLAILSLHDESLSAFVSHRLNEHLEAGTKSMAARARHTLKMLAKAGR